ncbi:hypothetical protein V6N12_069010 [Hibiscus sabdariffa]|uniref:Uncharacterized protein n=1 Tax=Hibiscus sabdariffa TaxID=183260 RepID=A0ABR2FD23_9ROSI
MYDYNHLMIGLWAYSNIDSVELVEASPLVASWDVVMAFLHVATHAQVSATTLAQASCVGEGVQGLRRKRCCSISRRMVSNMSLQHWCTKGQMKEKDKIALIPAVHVDSSANSLFT